MIRIVSYFINGVLIGLIIIAAAVFIGLKTGYIRQEQLPRPYVIYSGSMEPTIKTGSVILALPSKTYSQGDIISYSPTGKAGDTVTHRIEFKLYPGGVGAEPIFITSGDANKTFDQKELKQKDIIGKVILALPYLGYLVDFAKKPQGFILFVIVPVTIIIYEELKFLKSELLKLTSKGSTFKASRTIEDKGTPKAAAIVPAIGAVLVLAGVSASFFSDIERSSGNVFTAGVWEVTPPPPGPGDVVINEIMWMGTQGRASDEWVELRNRTNHTINLTGWSIVNLGTGPGGIIIIPSGKTILAGGFFVISNRSNNPQSNSAMSIIPDVVDNSIQLQEPGEQLILKDSFNNSIDTANGTDGWLAGQNGTGQSPEKAMERNSSPGNGTEANNWHSANAQVNIDVGGRELASPGAANSSP